MLFNFLLFFFSIRLGFKFLLNEDKKVNVKYRIFYDSPHPPRTTRNTRKIVESENLS